jgi:translocation and assembly module TamA
MSWTRGRSHRLWPALWLATVALSSWAADGTPATPPEVGFVVTIEAPAPIEALLQKHLDLVKLARLADVESTSESEWPRLIEAAPRQIRSLLQTEGFFDPVIQIRETQLPPASDGAPGTTASTKRVQIQVQPGRQTTVSGVQLRLTGAVDQPASGDEIHAQLTRERLQAQWALPAEAPFRNAPWSEAKTGLLTRLRAQGYLDSVLTDSQAEVDPTAARAKLDVQAESGPLHRVGTLTFIGLKLHDESSVRPLAPQPSSAPVTEAWLGDFQDRLQKSGLFNRASVSPQAEAADPARTPIVVEVEEARRHQIVAGVGVSANTGPRGTVEHIDRRVFGEALTARNKAEWGQTRQAWDGELSTHTGEGLKRWLVGGTIERLMSSSDTVLSQRLRLGQAQDGEQRERLSYAAVDRSSRRTDTDRSSAEALTANQDWTWRTLDNPVLPTQGQTFSLHLALGQARDSSQSSGVFSRAWARWTLYRPLGDAWFSQVRLELGDIQSPSGTRIPDGLRFRAGGDESIRGYSYRSIGPTAADGNVEGGLKLWTSSVEIARPISADWPQFWGAAFIDAGQAGNQWTQMQPVVGTGFGVRWRSPVGPLKLDLARAQDTGRWRVHFSVGIAL